LIGLADDETSQRRWIGRIRSDHREKELIRRDDAIWLLLSAVAKFADLVNEKFPDLVDEKFVDLVDEKFVDLVDENFLILSMKNLLILSTKNLLILSMKA
jgi:hypothetical protein